MREKRVRRQQGQSIILVAVAMVALVLFVAITVDMSNAYRHRRIAQNAADAAALGGAEELGRQLNAKSSSGQRIAEAVNDFAERNGIADSDGILANAVNENVEAYYLDSKQNEIGLIGGGSVPKNAVGIRAYTYITAPTFFGGIAGFSGYPLSAKAAVYFEVACTGGWCMLPIAINDNGYLTSESAVDGQCFNMWDGAGTGNFGWVNWSLQEVSSSEEGGTGYGGVNYSCQDPALYDWYPGLPEELPDDCSAGCLDINMNPDYCTRINPADIYVGADVGGTTGVKNGNQIRGWLEWYSTRNPPVPVKVLIYDKTSGNVKTGQEAGCAKDDRPNGLKYNVAGFACFEMTGFRLSSGGGIIECDRYDGPDGTVMLTCHDGPSSSLTCDPTLAIDYPGDCKDAYGNDCDYDDYETGEVNRITGKFVSCNAGVASNCKAVGNMLAPRLDE